MPRLRGHSQAFWKHLSKDLVPTVVMNILSTIVLSVAKNNGNGNTRGLDNEPSYIYKLLHLMGVILTLKFEYGGSHPARPAVDGLRMSNWARKLLKYWHLQNQALNLAPAFIHIGNAGAFLDLLVRPLWRMCRE